MNLLLLDSGHAKSTPGKVAIDKSLYEWDFNNKMQYNIKKRCEENGIHVYLSNPNPETVSDIALTTRANKMNDYWKSKGKPKSLMISLHANAYGGDWNDVRGSECFVAGNASATSKSFAKIVNDEIVTTMKKIDGGAKDRGVKTQDFTVIYKTLTPAILVEYGFYTNKNDLKILKNNQSELVEATVRAICKYFDIKYKGVQSEGSKLFAVCVGAYSYETATRMQSELISKGYKDTYLIPR